MGFPIPLEPTENRILIKQDEKPKDQMKGKILLPQDAQKRPNYGTILSVGPGRKRDDGSRTPMTLQVGWRVAYPEYAATRIEHEETEYLILDEQAVLAVFTSGK